MKPQLQAFQIAMLQTEYGDFGSQPRFHDLVDFFFGALYAPAEFGLRNESFRTLHEWLSGIVGHDPVRVLAQAIELYELTESLDDDMLLALRAEGTDGNAAVITQGAWESAYQRVGRRLDRQRQADLIVDNGKVLEIACRVPFVHTQLRAFRPAAALLGWGHVVDFLLQGQEALATGGRAGLNQQVRLFGFGKMAVPGDVALFAGQVEGAQEFVEQADLVLPARAASGR